MTAQTSFKRLVRARMRVVVTFVAKDAGRSMVALGHQRIPTPRRPKA